MNSENNRIVLNGTVEEPLCYSHRIYGENFFTLMLGVRRRSGTVDHLPVTVSERLVNHNPVTGERCMIEGQIRTYNEFYDMKNHLNIIVFCREIHFNDEDVKISSYDRNDVTLTGFTCRKPYYRVSPLGREICDIMLASNRIHGKSDYIPCIIWGRNARFCSKLEIGASVSIKGRLQSRVYKKITEDGSTELRTAYEVSAGTVEIN
jgi:primosomal replication protein N